jgi:hypothetical protein
MIAGDTNQRNFTLPVPDPPKSNWGSDPAQSSQAGLAQKAIGFNCLDYSKAAEGSLYRHFMPDKAYLDANCVDGIRAELMFPSCWNGKDVTSDNKKSHVAYPNTIMDGVCPPDFPVRLPGLFYESIWNTAEFAGVDGEFVWSNGDPTGYGYHGDFIMGWAEDFLQSAVDTCTNPSGRIQDCPLFTIQDDADVQACKINKGLLSALLDEDLIGPMGGLPGDVPVNAGPGYVVKGAPVPDESSAAPVPTLSHSAGSTVAATASGLAGAVFNEASGAPKAAVAAVEPTTPPAPTTTPPPTVSLESNQKAYTTSYKTEGNKVIEVIVIEEFTTVTDTPETVTQYTTMAKRHSHNRRHHGRA